MDALDLKIIRALLSERSVAPSNRQVTSSLRSIALRLGADDVTVNTRYRKLRESGAMSGWRLAMNPRFFGLRSFDVTLDVHAESAKEEMITLLSSIEEIVGIRDFYGKGLKLTVMFGSDEESSRVIDLITRITSPEAMTVVRWALPPSRTERLTATDVAIIQTLAPDPNVSLPALARVLGKSTKTVRNHVEKLLSENTIHSVAGLDMSAIPGLISLQLSYAYSDGSLKVTVDSKLMSRFEPNYLSVMFSDPDTGYIWLVASTMKEVQDDLDWVKSLPGVVSARADILTRTILFPQKLIGRLDNKSNWKMAEE